MILHCKNRTRIIPHSGRHFIPSPSACCIVANWEEEDTSSKDATINS